MADLDLATILADGEYLRRVGDTLDGGPGGIGVDAEGAVDATAAAFAAGTHTNVTVTYNDTAGSISLASTSTGGSTILDGAIPPASTVGTVGAYYEDTVAGILYGPKTAAGFGAAQTLTVVGSGGLPDPVTNSTNRDFGVRVQFARPGRVAQVRYRRLASSANPLTVRAWNDTTSTKIVEVADPQSTAGLFTVTFPTPVVVGPGNTYTFTVGAAAGVPTSGVSPTVTNTADMTFLAMRDSTPTNTWPNTSTNGTTYYVEPVFEPDGAWPITVRQIAGYTSSRRTVTTYVLTPITATITDAGCYLRFTGTNPTYTVPPNSTVAFPVGTQIDGIGTATAMTLIQGSGVTITKARTLVTVGAGSGWTLIKTATDAWDAHGDLV